MFETLVLHFLSESWVKDCFHVSAVDFDIAETKLDVDVTTVLYQIDYTEEYCVKSVGHNVFS